jgi:hypothetical protein
MSSHDDNQRNTRDDSARTSSPADQQRIEELLARVEASYRADQEAEWHRGGSSPARPGEGPPNKLGSPVNWHDLSDEDYSETFGALCTFLEWAIPRWNFTTDQFPYHCWWKHPDVFEEITAWWGLWQGYIRNPNAHIVDALTFHERTDLVKERLANTYRGRCRHKHEPAPPPPAIAIPDLPGLVATMIPDSCRLPGSGDPHTPR